MAGLYTRLAASDDTHVKVHILVAGLKAYATGSATKQQILDAINAALPVALSGAAITDYDNIAAQLDLLPDATSKLVYGQKVEFCMIGAEEGVINETFWRSTLNIA